MSNEMYGGDLDEKIDFQSVMFFKFITQNIIPFEIEGLMYFQFQFYHIQFYIFKTDLSTEVQCLYSNIQLFSYQIVKQTFRVHEKSVVTITMSNSFLRRSMSF